MSAIACEIIGTGDGELKNCIKNEGTESKIIAKDIVFEIIDNALDIVDDTAGATIQKIMDQIPVKEYKEKYPPETIATKEKLASPLIGTGDQKSNENFEEQEPVPYHPPVEKKNRLTDLVKNSKQILAKIMMTDSKMVLQDEKKEEEEIVKVIELDCIQISDLPFKSKSKILPEEVPLPKNDSHDLLSLPPPEEQMDEIGLSASKDEPEVTEKRRMTFPRAGGSRARAAFAAKCRTLKREATNLKKKKWDVGGKIVGFFRKKRGNKEEEGTKSKATQQQQDLENVTDS